MLIYLKIPKERSVGKFKEKGIIFRETLGIDRVNEPISFGIPFKKGELRDTDSISLVDEYNNVLPLQSSPLLHWPDGSVKWALLDFQVSIEADSTNLFKLIPERLLHTVKGVSVISERGALIVNTGEAEFHISTLSFLPIPEVITQRKGLIITRRGKCSLTVDDKEIIPEVNKIAVECRGVLRSTVLIEGDFQIEGNKRADIICRLHFFRNKTLVRIDLTIRNPKAAYHSGGLWDLGDKGSLLFKELRLVVPLSGRTEHIKYSLHNGQPFTTEPHGHLLIYQESSGGEHWNSPNHINRFGKVPFRIKGYEIRKGNKLIGSGQRATPVLWAGSERTGVSAALTYFWQNFPKSLEVDEDSLSIGLFPGHFSDLYELQGGEQKTETVYLDFSLNPSTLEWVREPLVLCLKPEEYEKAGAIPNLYLPDDNCTNDYRELIEAAISGENSFMAKREITDEFGWRSFGEVYADHESVRCSEGEYFISHYNNQYDLIDSVFRQFVLTADLAWYKIMTELATHVRDIDIYHTYEDREEFNHGLFWHTDHYIDAATATHRSFSKAHLKVKDPLFCGGGPATEHCYTTGLMYYYLLTGDRASREAVMGLAEWSLKASESPSTFVGVIYNFKNKLPTWKSALKGEETPYYKYPMNRGTGNTVVACLDAFELSGNTFYLSKAEEIIKECVHPLDDVESRNLLDAERHWSYTVFLTSLGRYLDKKIEIGEIDLMYTYGRNSLLRYTAWMMENEYPYLEKSDILEFPTETWPAQDMRKSCVFCYAAKHSEGSQKQAYIEKADFFFKTSLQEMRTFKTRNLTRPIALLLQNGWVQAFLCRNKNEDAPRPDGVYDFGNVPEHLTKLSICKHIIMDMFFALKKTSLDKELRWIKSRIRSVKK